MLADFISFKSEKIPKIKIVKEKSINDKISSLIKYKYPKNMNIPPVKGIFEEDANFWCLSPVSLINIFFLSKNLLINKVNIVKISK